MILPHILVVDDDRRIRQLLQSYLLENGFRVSVAATAAEAREKMRGVMFDLAVLDIMMPGESGLDLTQSLRGDGNPIPVLMLSALADASDRIAGLETGSDDYLPNPSSRANCCCGSRACCGGRMRPGATRGEVMFGPFVFHLQRGELRKGAELIRLTTREKDFLRILSARAGAPVARTELAPEGSEEGARSVDVQINRLRQKIEADPSNPALPADGARGGLCAACRLKAAEAMPQPWFYRRFNLFLERHLPEGLFARALIILVAPMVLLQTIMTGLILDRHWDNVTRLLARSFARDISLLVELYEESDKDDAAVARIEHMANSRLALGLTIKRNAALAAALAAAAGFRVSTNRLTRYLRTRDRQAVLDRQPGHGGFCRYPRRSRKGHGVPAADARRTGAGHQHGCCCCCGC